MEQTRDLQRILGDVDKNWFMYRCGPRSGRDADKKRAAMEKKLNNQEAE